MKIQHLSGYNVFSVRKSGIFVRWMNHDQTKLFLLLQLQLGNFINKFGYGYTFGFCWPQHIKNDMRPFKGWFLQLRTKDLTKEQTNGR